MLNRIERCTLHIIIRPWNEKYTLHHYTYIIHTKSTYSLVSAISLSHSLTQFSDWKDKKYETERSWFCFAECQLRPCVCVVFFHVEDETRSTRWNEPMHRAQTTKSKTPLKFIWWNFAYTHKHTCPVHIENTARYILLAIHSFSLDLLYAFIYYIMYVEIW